MSDVKETDGALLAPTESRTDGAHSPAPVATASDTSECKVTDKERVRPTADALLEHLTTKRAQLLDFLRTCDGRKDDLAACTVELEKKTGDPHVFRRMLLTGKSDSKLVAGRTAQSIWMLPTWELCAMLGFLLGECKRLERIYELQAGAGLFTARLRDFCTVPIEPSDSMIHCGGTDDDETVRFAEVTKQSIRQVLAEGKVDRKSALLVCCGWFDHEAQESFYALLVKCAPLLVVMVGEDEAGGNLPSGFNQRMNELCYRAQLLTPKALGAMDVGLTERTASCVSVQWYFRGDGDNPMRHQEQLRQWCTADYDPCSPARDARQERYFEQAIVAKYRAGDRTTDRACLQYAAVHGEDDLERGLAQGIVASKWTRPSREANTLRHANSLDRAPCKLHASSTGCPHGAACCFAHEPDPKEAEPPADCVVS